MKNWKAWPARAQDAKDHSGKIDSELSAAVTDITGRKAGRAQVNHWFTGQREPTISQFIALCEEIGADPGYVLLSDGGKTPSHAEKQAPYQGRTKACSRTANRMKAVLTKLVYGLLIMGALIGVVVGFLAYFVRSFNRGAGAYFDGLGRQLDPTPFIVRIIFGTDSLWAGWGYFALDFVIFWVAIGIGYALLQLPDDSPPSTSSTPPSREPLDAEEILGKPPSDAQR